MNIQQVRPLADRVLIQMEREPEKIAESSLIILPDIAKTSGNFREKFTRIGVIVATGPGERCGGGEYIPNPEPAGGLKWKRTGKCQGEGCPKCHGTGRLPMLTAIGDRVWYDHDSGSQFEEDGEVYVLAREKQRILAVLD